MKYKKLGSVVGVVTLVFGLSGWANSACEIDGTNASSVQSDSGNGNYECTLFTTSDGTMMEDVTDEGYSWGLNEDGDYYWSAPVDEDGNPMDVDLVSVATNSGKRCNYLYPDQPLRGDGLTTSDGGLPKYITICADRATEALPPPPPPEPFSTAKDGCSAQFDYTGNSDPDAPLDVTFGYSKQLPLLDASGNLILDDNGDPVVEEGVAVCTKGGVGQHQCVNECVPRDPTVSDCSADANGVVPLGCAQCEWEYVDPAGSDKDLKYCWHWENRVCDADIWPLIDGVPDLPGYCNNRTDDGTYIPSPKKKSLHAQIDVTTGSDCYTVTIGPLYGGYTYSYQYCP